MASLVSFNSETKVLTINETVFDLNLYTQETGIFQESEPISVRSKIATISLGGDVKISNFYDGNNNQYTLLNALEDDDIVQEREKTVQQMLEDLKSTSQQTLTAMIPNVNVDVEIDGETFTKLLSVVMLATKIFTGVLVLQKVSKASCKFVPKKQDDQEKLDRKITSLEEFLEQTSSLLFKMDTI